jgi:hypothetical protein
MKIKVYLPKLCTNYFDIELNFSALNVPRKEIFLRICVNKEYYQKSSFTNLEDY